MLHIIRPVVISYKSVYVGIKLSTVEDAISLSQNVEIRAESLWNYLLSHTNWQTLLGWIRSMALKIGTSHDDPSLYVGEKFAVCGGDVELPSLPRCIFSQVRSCHKVVKEMILEELTRLVYNWSPITLLDHVIFEQKNWVRWTGLQISKPFFHMLINTGPSSLTSCQSMINDSITLYICIPIAHGITYFCPFRNGMFTTSQLSNFSLLLHYLSTTQTLFGDNLPLLSLDGCSEGGSDTEGCIVSIFQFHQSFIDYCIRLRLVNLLYHYLDFYR